MTTPRLTRAGTPLKIRQIYWDTASVNIPIGFSIQIFLLQQTPIY